MGPECSSRDQLRPDGQVQKVKRPALATERVPSDDLPVVRLKLPQKYPQAVLGIQEASLVASRLVKDRGVKLCAVHIGAVDLPRNNVRFEGRSFKSLAKSKFSRVLMFEHVDGCEVGQSTPSVCESTPSVCESTGVQGAVRPLPPAQRQNGAFLRPICLCESTRSMCESTPSVCESTRSVCESTPSVCDPPPLCVNPPPLCVNPQVCQGLYAHYPLPNGKMGHFYDHGPAIIDEIDVPKLGLPLQVTSNHSLPIGICF
jgi:hypothetical protein